MKKSIDNQIMEQKIIAIGRGLSGDEYVAVAGALNAAGIKLLEFTFNQSATWTHQDTAKAIETVRNQYDGMLIGAGTVTSCELVRLAADAGASFIVSPNVDPAVINTTKHMGLVSIPGALTPTEILLAHSSGADFVKLFPASKLGTDYIKAICAPISNVRLIATGGIDEANILSFFNAGCVGVGVGGMLTRRDIINAGRLNEITKLAKKLIDKVERR